MPSVITNTAKTTMISSISGADMYIALLNNVTLSAASYLKENFGSWSSLSAHEISGTGYTAGGVLLTGTSAYSSSANDTAYFNGSTVLWNTATISSYGFALYRQISGLVIAIVQFSGVTEGSPETSVSGPFSVTWSNNQLLQMVG
jgi:hypothetical protein